MRRYIYNQAKCGRCGSGVKSWNMGEAAASVLARALLACRRGRAPAHANTDPPGAGGRTCYACTRCQPEGVGRPPPAGITDAKLFRSGCAREPLASRLSQVARPGHACAVCAAAGCTAVY